MSRYFRGIGIFALSVVISGFLYFQSNQVFAKDKSVAAANQSSPAKAEVVKAQDNGQEQENDQECENKKHPSGDKPDPNKLACECHPTCPDGKRQEDNKDCIKRCKPDKCKCPDPCPKT